MEFNNLRPGADNPLLSDANVFAANLRAEKVQPDIANDLVIHPATTVCTFKMLADNDIAVRICGMLIAYRLAAR